MKNIELLRFLNYFRHQHARFKIDRYHFEYVKIDDQGNPLNRSTQRMQYIPNDTDKITHTFYLEAIIN